MQGLNLYQEDRPWGYFRQFCKNIPTTIKVIVVKPNESLSLQSHTKREEFWRVISGDGVSEIGEIKQEIKVGDEMLIPLGIKHRLLAGVDGLEVLEISFGDFDEDDIVRYEDKYNRV